MRVRVVVAAAFLAAVSGLAGPASACTGTVCDAVNYVCSLGQPGGGCLP